MSQVDVIGYRWPPLAMEWLGMHALMVYILLGCNLLPVFIQGLYWREPQNNIVSKPNLTILSVILT